MLNEDLALFIRQLNECLQTTDKARWAESVCHLYRSHTGAGVKLTAEKAGGGDFITVAEVLPAGASEAALTLPVYDNDRHIGSLTLTGSGFNDNARLAAEVLQALFTVLLRRLREQEQTEQKRRAEAVRAVINTLTFSELEAAVKIINRVGNGEMLLVAARIAEELKITRSVVVNALRKLEGAGMIETRSLGMKGTHIKIKNENLSSELGKLN